jgi:hypothetical protein
MYNNNYQQAADILANLATLYGQLAQLYTARPLDQAAIDQTMQQIEALEAQYQDTKAR